MAVKAKAKAKAKTRAKAKTKVKAKTKPKARAKTRPKEAKTKPPVKAKAAAKSKAAAAPAAPPAEDVAAGGEKGVSDNAVRAKTGKFWREWFAILDRWDAGGKGHAATAKHLAEAYSLNPWWSQTVAVRWELERGIREVGARSPRGAGYDEFEVSVQRTIEAPAGRCFAAFTAPADLDRWFTKNSSVELRVGGRYSNADKDHGEFLHIEPPRRLRFTWNSPQHRPGSRVEVTFEEKGRSRTAVRLQHMSIKRQEDYDGLKKGWAWAMDSLKSYLETGKPIPFSHSRRSSSTEPGAKPA